MYKRHKSARGCHSPAEKRSAVPSGRQAVPCQPAQVDLAAGTGSGRSELPPARRRAATLSLVLAVAIVMLALAGGLAPSLLPGTLVGRDAGWVAAVAIFAASYLALAVGRVPGLAIDRA